MRPRLTSLTLSGFRSFVDEATVEFPEAGLELLQGLNKDTGGSSGSGKSSVLLAVAFALRFCPFPATALNSRGSKKAMKVELRLETDEGEIRIKRSTTPVQMWINGEQVKGGAQAVEERLDQVLGVESEIRALLTYRAQRRPGLFLSKTDAEKKELLTRLLRLDKFEVAIEKCESRIDALELAQACAQDSVAFVQARLSEFPESKDPGAVRADLEAARKYQATQEQVLSRARQLVEKLTTARAEKAQAASDGYLPEIERWVAVREGLTKPPVDFDDTKSSELRTVIAGAQNRISALVTADDTRMKEGRAQRLLLQQKLLTCRQLAGQTTLLERDQERALADLGALEADTCPTCDRPWDQTEQEKAHLRLKLVDIEQGLRQCTEAAAREKELQAEIAAQPEFEANPLIGKLKDAKAKAEEQLKAEEQRKEDAEGTALAKYRQALAEAAAAITDLRLQQRAARDQLLEAPAPDLARAQDIVEETHKDIQSTRLGIALWEQELEQAASLLLQRQKMEAQLLAAEMERDKLDATMKEERDLLAALGREGFLGSIFDEVLDEISDETNNILASVANTRHCTLTFKSESTTQKGTVRKAIVPVVAVDGVEAPLEAGISGGMLSAIELAVDLAVGAVVTRREGVSLGWLILDECFQGLGPVEMESCMEILSRYAQDRLVLVVDHASEFKSLFRDFITIEYQEGRSRFA